MIRTMGAWHRAACCCLVMSGLWAGALWADDATSPNKPSTTPAVAPAAAVPESASPGGQPAPESSGGSSDAVPASKVPTLQLQVLDDPATPFVPLRPPTEAEKQSLEAAVWFATGRVLEARNDFQGALNAYKSAIQHDPRAVAVYRQLISLCYALNLANDATQYSLKVIELDPTDYQTLWKLGRQFVGDGDLASALRFLEQAARSPLLKRESPTYVLLQHDLAIIYSALSRPEDTARCYELVLDALLNPEKYHLDFRSRAQLLADPAATYERMGQAFLEVKRSQLALQAFQKAAESKKGNAGGLSFNLAQVYLQAGDPEKALEELQTYFDAQRQSKGRSAYELLAEVLAKLGKSEELIPRLEELADDDPRNSTLQFYLADQYALAKRFDDAERLYKKTLTASADAQGYLGLAAIYRQTNRPAELLKALGSAYNESGDIAILQPEFKALLQDPKLIDSLVETASELAKNSKLEFAAGFVLAQLSAEAKRTESASELYRYLLSTRKERAPLIYMHWGEHLLEMHRYGEAAKVLEEASNDPQAGDARATFLYLLAQALEMDGKTKAALEAIAAARQVAPDSPTLQFQEAWIYYHAQQFDEAIQRFEKLTSSHQQLQFRPLVRRANFVLSNIYVQQGDMRRGEQILEEMLKETPDDASVNNDLGYLYADSGKNLEQAEVMIRKAVATEPENGAYLDSLGWVLFKLGKYEDAIVPLEQAVTKSIGGDETVWEHLGDACDKAGKPEKALAAWKKALSQARANSRPDPKLVQRLTDKLKGAGVTP